MSTYADGGTVILGATPNLPARVWAEAARYAALFGTQLVVAHVDVTRFVTYEDPDGVPHSAPVDLTRIAATHEFERVQEAAEKFLAPSGVAWTIRTLVGDPAMALKGLADELDAAVIVVGTRRRGFGETMREFFTGSVAARLAHRQHRPVLVVPLQESVVGDDDPWRD
ncbi:universal stress protein [Microbacterium sp. cx-55]|uniref:universal stress protein n=1 Tax=unclassified Microbacterium TaxID=2609290 RepID=UPI001CC10A97|nr:MULTISPECIES: universal stress protein [unclassified Microbacterium]MBZ4487368.1 universal stress protein [Microbacterium sp. cx-55]MCC4908512.1 universal stress protein [Microbacterium sp. cx-59]UGB35388.1 universal stress protein [Microbacterium sp. cx-55]